MLFHILGNLFGKKQYQVFLICNCQLFYRELERHYLSQIKSLKGELSVEKEQHLSLTQEIDHKKRYYSLQLSEQENKLKEDLCQMQMVT